MGKGFIENMQMWNVLTNSAAQGTMPQTVIEFTFKISSDARRVAAATMLQSQWRRLMTMRRFASNQMGGLGISLQMRGFAGKARKKLASREAEENTKRRVAAQEAKLEAYIVTNLKQGAGPD